VLNSVDQLGFSRQELIKAVTGFNQAQFRLFVATGSSPMQANLPAAAPDQQLGPRPAAPGNQPSGNQR
jgi:hypothetical protein